jgi:hypothetical protein
MGATKLPATNDSRCRLALERPLKFLTSQQIQQIDDVLAGLGAFGEVRLIKERGKLRFIQKLESKSLLGPPPPPQPER